MGWLDGFRVALDQVNRDINCLNSKSFVCNRYVQGIAIAFAAIFCVASLFTTIICCCKSLRARNVQPIEIEYSDKKGS